MTIRRAQPSVCPTATGQAARPAGDQAGTTEPDLKGIRERYVAGARQGEAIEGRYEVQRKAAGLDSPTSKVVTVAANCAAGGLVVAGGVVAACSAYVAGTAIAIGGLGIFAVRQLQLRSKQGALNSVEVERAAHAAAQKALLEQFRAKMSATPDDSCSIKVLAANGLAIATASGGNDALIAEVLGKIASLSPRGGEGAVADCALNIPHGNQSSELARRQRAVAVRLIAEGVGGPIGVAVGKFAAQASPQDSSKKANVMTDLAALKQVVQRSTNLNETLLARVARNARKSMPEAYTAPAAFLGAAREILAAGVSAQESSTSLLTRYALSQVDNLPADALFKFSGIVCEAIRLNDGRPQIEAMVRTAKDLCDTELPADRGSQEFNRAAVKLALQKLQHGFGDLPAHIAVAQYGHELSQLPEAADGAARQPLHCVMRQLSQVTDGTLRDGIDAVRMAAADCESPAQSVAVLRKALGEIAEGGVPGGEFQQSA